MELDIINKPESVYVHDETYFFDVIVEVENDFFMANKTKAIKELCLNFVNEQYFIPAYHTDYDCTGQHFSTRSEVIAVDKIYRLVTVRHWMGIDI